MYQVSVFAGPLRGTIRQLIIATSSPQQHTDGEEFAKLRCRLELQLWIF